MSKKRHLKIFKELFQRASSDNLLLWMQRDLLRGSMHYQCKLLFQTILRRFLQTIKSTGIGGLCDASREGSAQNVNEAQF